MWLANCDAQKRYCEWSGSLQYLLVAEPLRAIPVLFGNKVCWFEFSLLSASEKECPNVQRVNVNICEHCSTQHPNKRGIPEGHGRRSITHRTGESYCTNDNRLRHTRPGEWSVLFEMASKPTCEQRQQRQPMGKSTGAANINSNVEQWTQRTLCCKRTRHTTRL